MRTRKRPICHDQRRYYDCWRVESVFCRLKNSVASLHTFTSWRPTLPLPQRLLP
jgi:hypothetical protein